MKASFGSVTALLPAGPNFAAELALYTEHLGFTVVWQQKNMAQIRRDDVAFNLMESDNQEWANNSSYSIGVSDLDALYEDYRQVPAPVRIGPLEQKAWGRREFHMIVPSGVCYQFYQREAE